MDEKAKEFARELCALLEKYQLRSFTADVHTGFGDKNSIEHYKFVWVSGRHGDAKQRIEIHYEERHIEKLDTQCREL